MYVELKTDQNDRGPAWIGRVRFSKSGRTIYTRGLRLQRWTGGHAYANYVDLDSDDDPDPDRWLDVDSVGSRAAYQDMVDFTASLSDAAARNDLTHALDGRGAFRRFQSTLDRHEQHRVHWRVLSTERRAGRAREWLAEQGYDAIP